MFFYDIQKIERALVQGYAHTGVLKEDGAYV